MKGHKNLHLMANGMAGLLSCLLLFSCNNDDYPMENESGKVSENICFGISSDETSQTRSVSGIGNEDGRTVSRFVLRSENSADTLCVRATVSDGIVSPVFVKDKAVTRGTPITSLDTYGNFRVLAYWQKGGNLQQQFFMNETATNNGNNVWSTENIYYWPGTDHTLQFYAYAPVDAGFTAPTTSADAILANYTVPTDVTQQKDIVVATTTELAGSNNRAVPLNFKHICTAVRFVVGSEIQLGTITSITLKGVKGSGSYNMASSQWTLGETVTDFSQSPNKVTDENSTAGDEITTPEGTFMMLPQELDEGAEVVVLFKDNTSGQDRTLTASIAGQEWPMGKTVTYKLSISPEYNMNIEVPEDDKVQDAHYVSFPITVNVKDFTGNWTLTSNQPNDVFFTSAQTDLQKQGYWIDEDKGQPSVSGAGSGTFTYYVYATENVADVTRDIELQIKPMDNEQVIPATTTVQQLCPSWNGTLGCERIEDGDYPWGFYWTDDYKVIYDMTGCSSSDRQSISRYIRWTQLLHTIFPNWFPTDISYVDHEYTGGLIGIGSSTTIVTINFGQLNIANIAISEDDGLANTKELYNFNGISQVADIISRLEACAGFQVSQQGNGLLNPTEYAARACTLKNKYIKQTDQGNDIAVLPDANFVWYLPSKNEFSSISDTEKPLDGEYWTSTADNQSNENAYKVNSSTNTTSLDLRNAFLNVRAVRKK